MKQKEAEKTKQRKLRMVSHLQKDFINIPRGPSKGKKTTCFFLAFWSRVNIQSSKALALEGLVWIRLSENMHKKNPS